MRSFHTVLPPLILCVVMLLATNFSSIKTPLNTRTKEGLANSKSSKELRNLAGSPVSQDFTDQLFSGTWTNSSPNPSQSQFGFFSSTSGNILLAINFNAFSSTFTELDMKLYDPQYEDGNLVILSNTSLNACDLGNNSWQCACAMSVKQYTRRSLQSTQQEVFNLMMKLVPITVGNLTPQNSQFIISLTSNNYAGFSATLTLDQNDNTWMFLLYSLMITALGCLQMYSIQEVIKDVINSNEVASKKMSMLTVGFITVFDSYVAIAHLYMALEFTDYFYYFMVPTLLYFAMSTILDMKLLVLIWKNRFLVTFHTPREVRKGFAIFYLKFYFAMISFFVLTYQFYLYNEYLMFLPIYIIPQIVHNYKLGNQPYFSYFFTFGMLFSRFFIPFYFRGCPENIRDLTPSLWFSLAFPATFLFPVLVICLQKLLSPRFFVPRKYRGGFDYYKTYVLSDPILAEDCPICMSKLKFDPEEEEVEEEDEESNSVNRQLMSNAKLSKKKKKIVVTQCIHRYHVSCFKAWINVKPECPSCRHQLLPILD